LFIANDIAGNDSDKTPREVLRLFRYVVKTIRREFPETPVFWIAVTPTESRWKVWPAIQEANMLIRDYCDKSRNLHFIATEKEFLDNAGFPRNDLFLPDLLHLNPEGYEVWSGIIKSELDRVLIR
jgi:lysophospholipase L1-like esterase